MKKLVYLAISVLCLVVLEGCAKAALPTDATINPGDKVGDFLITSGGDDASQLTPSDCVEEGASKETCKVAMSRKINVSWGVFDETRSGKLDELWSGHTYEMMIEGRPVNLQAFGSIDVYHPAVGTMRKWNVVIAAEKPGQITIHHSTVVGGEAGEATLTLVFIAPE